MLGKIILELQKLQMAPECGFLTRKGNRKERDISPDILMYFAGFMSRAALRYFHDAKMLEFLMQKEELLSYSYPYQKKPNPPF